MATEIRCRTAGEPTRVYKVSLSALNVHTPNHPEPYWCAPVSFYRTMVLCVSASVWVECFSLMSEQCLHRERLLLNSDFAGASWGSFLPISLSTGRVLCPYAAMVRLLISLRARISICSMFWRTFLCPHHFLNKDRIHTGSLQKNCALGLERFIDWSKNLKISPG